MKLNFKRFLSGILSITILTSAIPSVAVFAENDSECYPYTLFAASSNEGAITVNAGNFCVNGNVATNGTIFSSGNMNVNGTVQENANEEMIYILKKLNYSYFNGDNVDRYTNDYSYEDMNININNPMTVDGNLALTGNINLNSGIKAVEDVNINGEVKNTNQAIICSETGDIIINTSNVNFNGLIYAPYGDIIIDTNNLNLNNVVIIGQTITIDCPNINANYSSSVAELVGTDSELVVNLYAYGEYNSVNNSIDIEWETNYTNSNYEIWYSDDNINYTSVATTDATAYQYQIAEDFEAKYFKVSLTTNYGETIESVPFVVRRIEDGYETSYLDSDEDGLPDIYEIELGTDINKVDTDEDGLTDYQELFILGSDPLKFDSITEGVSDADADSDEDGLSNLQEIELGTDPRSTDTDEDGIPDFNEVTLYGTDPLNPDTDEDGVKDGDELLLYLDPKNPLTHGYPDLEYTSVQEIKSDSAVFSAINTEDSPYQMSLSMKTNGYAESNLKVNESRYSVAIENDAMLGISADISISDVCSPEDIVVKYSINQGYIANTLNKYSDCDEFKDIKRLNIFKFDDELNMLLPIETKFDVENNSLYAEVDELGTYCVLDMEIWLDSLGVEVPVNNTDTNNGILSPKYLPKKSTASTASTEWEPTYTTVPLDLVFILQTAGYSTDYFDEDKDIINDFCAYAFEEYSDVNVYFITFDKSSSKILTSSTGEKYFTNKTDIITALDSITYKPDVSDYCDRGQAFENFFENVTVRNDADVFIYQVMNGSTTCKTNYDNEDVIEKVKDKVFTAYSEIGTYSWHYTEDDVHARILNAIQENGDLFLNLDDNTLSNMEEHLKNKRSAAVLPVYNIIVPTKWKKVQLNDILSPDNDVDTDEDGLTDWEEVKTDSLIWNADGSFSLPTCLDTYGMTGVVNAFQRWEDSEYNLLINQIYQLKVLPIRSDPNSKDSDADGINDKQELYLTPDMLPSEEYSNPLSVDTDDDGINDYSDPFPKEEEIFLDWESTWSFINANDYMERRNITELIFRCNQKVLNSDFYHTAIIVFFNKNSNYYNEQQRYILKDKKTSVVENSALNYSETWNDIYYITLAAGPNDSDFESKLSYFKWKLTAGFNRDEDLKLNIKYQMINLTTSSDVNDNINKLIENQAYFISNYNKKLQYEAFDTNEQYQNCNSYAAGLLAASNIDDLGHSVGYLQDWQIPKYSSPIDSKYFGVTQS